MLRLVAMERPAPLPDSTAAMVPADPPGDRALAHLRGLETALIGLAEPLRGASRYLVAA